MKDKQLMILSFVLPLVIAGAQTLLAAETDTFAEMVGHYERIRQALLQDTSDGVADHATAIEEIAEGLTQDLDAGRAGVEESKVSEVADLLPDLQQAAASLATAEGIDAAREALSQLTKPLVRYRALVEGDRPVVAYCPMANKAWLQPAGEIGNPYYGQSMAHCGEIVSE